MCFQWKSSLNCKTRNYFLTQLLSSAALSFSRSVLLFLPMRILSPTLSPSPLPLRRRSGTSLANLLLGGILGEKALEVYRVQQFIIIAALCVAVLRACLTGDAVPLCLVRENPLRGVQLLTSRCCYKQ